MQNFKKENQTIVKDIALEIFYIRKNRFLMSAPKEYIQEIEDLDLFRQVEINLRNLWINRDLEEQIVCYDYFIQCSRSWESFSLKDDKTRRFSHYKKDHQVLDQVTYQTRCWLQSLKRQWNLITLEEDNNIEQAKQNMLKNIEIISKLVKQKIEYYQIQQFFQETKLIKFKNIEIDYDIWGFTSLTSNKIYFNENYGLEFQEVNYLEAMLVDGFCYWIIQNKDPLIIVSEYYQSKLKNGYISEVVDVYLQTAYGKYIYTPNPLGMCQYFQPIK